VSIAAISEENSASAEQVSAATEELSAQASEVVTSATSLAGMAQRLDDLLGRFKLDASGAEPPVSMHATTPVREPARRSRAA
jgi:hypothetical protein